MPAAQICIFSPALANENIIDLSIPAGAKIYKAGTEPLSIQFECTKENIKLLHDQQRDKLIMYHSPNILNIT